MCLLWDIKNTINLCLWFKFYHRTLNVMPQRWVPFDQAQWNTGPQSESTDRSVCGDVSVEPDLQPLTGEQLAYATSNVEDGACLDIAANGFWGGWYEKSFFDVCVFNPHPPSNRQCQLSACYRKHEKKKKRAYEQRVKEVEHVSFTSLVLPATGGMANEATHFYKRLASRLATKWDHSYSSTMSWLRCRLTFSLLCSAIQCIMGARSSCGLACKPSPPIHLVNSESRLNTQL